MLDFWVNMFDKDFVVALGVLGAWVFAIAACWGVFLTTAMVIRNWFHKGMYVKLQRVVRENIGEAIKHNRWHVASGRCDDEEGYLLRAKPVDVLQAVEDVLNTRKRTIENDDIFQAIVTAVWQREKKDTEPSV